MNKLIIRKNSLGSLFNSISWDKYIGSKTGQAGQYFSINRVVVLVLTMIFASLSTSLYAGGISVSGKGVGTAWRSMEADANGDGFGGGRSSAVIKGNGGFHKATGQNDLLPWTGPGTGAVCFDESGDPSALKLYFKSSAVQMIHKKGDQVFFALDPDRSEESFACLEVDTSVFPPPVTGRSTATVHRIVIGGTGRFRDATGTHVVTTSSIDLGSDPATKFAGHASFTVEISMDLEY